MYPSLQKGKLKRQTIASFGGLNARDPQPGEFLDMENLCAAHFPALAPRRRRGLYAADASPTGMIAKDSLCYTEGSHLVVNGYRVEMGLESGEKQLVSMGAYLIIFPDKKYINTLNFTEMGNLEAVFENDAIHICLCDEAGQPLPDPVVSDREVAGQNGSLWMDTATNQLMQYSAATELWVPVTRPLLRLQAAGIGKNFSVGDGVFLEGFSLSQGAALPEMAVITAVGADFVVLPGLVHRSETASGRIARRVPNLDFVTQCGNRLWGCRFGLEGDVVVNQLYGCKLGDFKNWYCYNGLSTDSFAASVGSDGVFTAAATHLGHPVFFKADCIHKIYISADGAHKVQDTPALGVAKGSARSLAEVAGQLLYLSPGGFAVYDGSLPVRVGQQLPEGYTQAVGGALEGRYFVSACRQGQRELLVYDREKGFWHRQDSLPVTHLCACRGQLYAAAGGSIWALEGDEPAEEAVNWMAITGIFGITGYGSRHLSRVEVRAWLAVGSRMTLSIRYDEEGLWHQVATVTGKGGAVCVPVRPHRCSRYQLKLAGTGEGKVFAISQIVEQGGDGA